MDLGHLSKQHTMNTLLPLTHPEIEYRAAEQGKKSATTTTGQSAVEKQGSPTLVDILEVYQDRIEWKDKVEHSQLPEICPSDGESPKLRALYGDTAFALRGHRVPYDVQQLLLGYRVLERC
ncbi:unnamed protein product [Cyclocybe aegerita]|uniref:Uncharacterized protein n=1 Tax=Cyclocybe aegerita TaxID=1973307 RepID=A0A8S0VYC3_CYCAE|nr:unnamed protein product [Cyclocybe aegerita]